ncbi:29546_t:CDS:2, partial [Gigaspora margarita]
FANCDDVNTSGCKCTNDVIGGLNCGYELKHSCLSDPSSLFQCNPGGTKICRYGPCTYGCCGTFDGRSHCCKDSKCTDCPPGQWYKKTTTVSSPISSSTSLADASCNNPVPNSCDFYTKCLDNKFKCGPTRYPIKYGDKNCKKFINEQVQF